MGRQHDFDFPRFVSGTIIAGCICLSLFGPLMSLAQLPPAEKASDDAVEDRSDLVPLELRYRDPKTYPAGTKRSIIIGDFKCGSDGTVFLPMMDDSTPWLNAVEHPGQGVDREHGFVVTALSPSGSVVRFLPGKIPGLRKFVPELRYFVSPSRVYTLEMAEIYDESDPQKTLGRAHLIFIFDYKGTQQGVIRLDPDLNAVNIAAFASGDLLVVSVNKWNQTTRLLILDSKGRRMDELSLFDEDYMQKLQPAVKEKKADSEANERASRQLALSKWAPFGDNLLLAPTAAQLPLIEVNENGIARTTTANLPRGVVIGALLASNDKVYHVLAGHLKPDDPQATGAGPPGAPGATFISDEIDDINPGDGTLLRRINFAHGLSPACAQDESYTFMTPREDDGKLQLIHGTVIH